MVRQNFLEFVLLKEQVDSKFASVEKRVNYLFGVQLTREEEDSERCWVKVEGGEDDIRRAKVRKKILLLKWLVTARLLEFDLFC